MNKIFKQLSDFYLLTKTGYFFFQMDNFQIVKHKYYFEQLDEKCRL